MWPVLDPRFTARPKLPSALERSQQTEQKRNEAVQAEAHQEIKTQGALRASLPGERPPHLTALRQLASSWSQVLQSAHSAPPQKRSESTPARLSTSQNSQVSRFLKLGLEPPPPSPEKTLLSSSGAEGWTEEKDPRNTTQGQGSSRVRRKPPRHREPPPAVLASLSPRLHNPPPLRNSWAVAGQRSHSGRPLFGQVPIDAPILDQAHDPRASTKPTADLGQFVLDHAGHSIEALLKKVYRQDEQRSLSSGQALHFFGLILRLGGQFTFDHSLRVLEVALDLADELGLEAGEREHLEQAALLKDQGEIALLFDQMSPQQLEATGDWLSRQLPKGPSDLKIAGLLHDIGKTQIPPEILYKPGRLSEEEYQVMKQHPILGEQILQPVDSLRHLCPIVRGHHERWDGRGYPDGLEGEAIPRGARIIALADVFDALIAERPYKPALAPDKVREILLAGRGTHFDPEMSDAFGRVIQRRYPELGNPFG